MLALYETVAEPLDGDPARRPSRPPTTSPSPPPRPCASCSTRRRGALGDRRARRLDRPGDERRRCASTASSPTSRPSRHDSTGWSTRSSGRRAVTGVSTPLITFLSDYGLRRRVRRRLPRRDRARSAPQARVIDLTHGVPRHDVRAGALVLRSALPYMPAGRAPRGRRSRRRRARGARWRCAARTAACSSGPTTACCRWPPRERFGGVVEAVDIAHSPLRLEPVSATFHGRDMFAPVAAHLAAGEPLAELGQPRRPRRASITLELPAPRREGERARGARAGRRPLRQRAARRRSRGARRHGR